jgi:hypothetical protein
MACNTPVSVIRLAERNGAQQRQRRAPRIQPRVLHRNRDVGMEQLA